MDDSGKIDIILDADTKYRDRNNYTALLWAGTRDMTVEQVNKAVWNLASLWYTA